MNRFKKILSIFIFINSIFFISQGTLNRNEYSPNISIMFILSGIYFIYLSGRILIFNKQSINSIITVFRKLYLTIRFGNEGKKMALKDIFKRKNEQELLERYKKDYNKVRNDVKLIMIEELKNRELILEEEYNEKLIDIERESDKLNKTEKEIFLKENEIKKIYLEEKNEKFVYNEEKNEPIDNSGMGIFEKGGLIVLALILLYFVVPFGVNVNIKQLNNSNATPIFMIPKFEFHFLTLREIIQNRIKEEKAKNRKMNIINNSEQLLKDYFKNNYNEDVSSWNYADYNYNTLKENKDYYNDYDSIHYNVYLKSNPKFVIDVKFYDLNNITENYNNFELKKNLESIIKKNNIDETNFFVNTEISDKTIFSNLYITPNIINDPKIADIFYKIINKMHTWENRYYSVYFNIKVIDSKVLKATTSKGDYKSIWQYLEESPQIIKIELRKDEYTRLRIKDINKLINNAVYKKQIEDNQGEKIKKILMKETTEIDDSFNVNANLRFEMIKKIEAEDYNEDNFEMDNSSFYYYITFDKDKDFISQKNIDNSINYIHEIYKILRHKDIYPKDINLIFKVNNNDIRIYTNKEVTSYEDIKESFRLALNK